MKLLFTAANVDIQFYAALVARMIMKFSEILRKFYSDLKNSLNDNEVPPDSFGKLQDSYLTSASQIALEN